MHSNVAGGTLENVVGSQLFACANPTEKAKHSTSREDINFFFILYPQYANSAVRVDRIYRLNKTHFNSKQFNINQLIIIVRFISSYSLLKMGFSTTCLQNHNNFSQV
ncbi:hypothetical protein BGV40_11785 [Methanosarcina sp. Ant1]|nr:hypothetical protein BGV40_11785 [Methanosarcina sp. Ant1]